MTEPAADEFTELHDAVIPRVDLVGKGANGMPFLIAKGADGEQGLLDAGFVRDLISKADPTPESDHVTVTGSAAAIAAMIANAPIRKADTAQEGTMTEPVADVAKDDLDASTVLAEAEAGATGSDTEPGSPAWEAVDAATARKWTAIAVRLKNAIETLGKREYAESSLTEDGGEGFDNSWDLEDAACAVDYAISVLAPFAVSEQAEADLGSEDLDLVGKTLGDFDVAPLEVLEGLAPVVKAGRVLSSSNEAAIRGAVDSLQKVLASLPAPVEDAATVAKEKELEVTATEPAIEAPVVKAKGDPMTPVYDESGKLVGMIDSADLVPIAPAAPAAEPAAEEAPAETPAEEAAPVAAAPVEDAATIPGTDTVQAPVEEDVTKAVAVETDTLTEALTTLAKQFEQHAELANVVKGLQERVEHLGRMPDDRKSPRLNGATGTPGIASRDGNLGDPYAELRKAEEEATDPVAKAAARNALLYAQIKDRVTSH